MRLLILALSLTAAHAATLQVGPGRSYTKWCAAVAAARDGDTIEVDGGNTYVDESCVVDQNNLTIKGIGSPRPVFRNSFLSVAQGNGKATIVAAGSNLTVDGIEFYGPSGAADNCVDAISGVCAGSVNAVRIEGSRNKGFTMRNSLVHFVEMGVLSALDLPADAEILIETSEFADNCVSEWATGYVHNVYINPVAKLTFRYNYSHRCNGGILLKSRAAENWILYNRLTDEVTTDKHLYFPAGYPAGGPGVPDECKDRLSRGQDCTFDLEPKYQCFGGGGWCYSGANNALQCAANAGHCYVIGNLIQQGPHSGNTTIVKYADEGQELKSVGQDFYFVNNTVINEQREAGPILTAGYPDVSTIDTLAKIWNNVFYTSGKTSDADICVQNTSTAIVKCDSRGNVYTSVDQFVDRANYDYHLKPGSLAIDAAIAPGSAPNGFSLAPVSEYLHPTGFSARPVNGPTDAGAYEYVGAAAPSIITSTLPEAMVGRPYSYQLTAAGQAPITWSAAGLPAWATLDASGLLHGTPSAAGAVTVRVMAGNPTSRVAHDLLLTVRPVPTAPLHRPSRAKK